MLSNDKRKWRHSGHTRAAETCSSTVATIMRWPRLNWTEPRPGIRKWFAIAAASYAARSRPSCCRSETAALPEVQEQFRNGVFGGAERYCGEATSPQTSMQNLQNLHSATRLIRTPCHHWVVRLVTWHSSPAKRVSGGSVPTERDFRLQFMSLCHSQIPLHPFASVACSRSWGIADLWVLHGRESTSIAMSPVLAAVKPGSSR
ncbi:hypothetical protein CABS01_01145 [Colletotrichum abscissum]|uniref:uncharacterized protein n=1 Tax=Colletotrichum abscissum TaxID=1671311 RepID=UPI0027D61120|nr:uncharacterized protein CABS01_01145 [Colletotrichum abscissum]KAK1505677.1 hypothetical protein CABS01_01145 [Colletotrichum abscissum]